MKGNIVASNSAIEKVAGTKKEELIGKNLFTQGFFEEKIAEQLKKNIKIRLKGTYIAPYEVELQSKNGKVYLLEINAKKINDGNRILDVIIFRDITQRALQQKELEQDLIESQLKFETITDSTFDGIVVFDTEEKIKYWNAAAQRIFGYKAKEVMGKKLEETVIPSSMYDTLMAFRHEFAKNPRSVSSIREISAKKKNKTIFPVEVSLSPLKIGEEKLMLATVRDITERKNAEYALKQQRDMLEAVAKNTDVGLALITRDYRIFWTNQRMKSFFGKDIQNKICYNQMQNRKTLCSDCGAKKIFEGQDNAIFETSGFDVNGNEFSLQLTYSPIRDKNGEIFAALQVAVPTTYRKKMENKVRDVEELYHALFEQTPLGVLVVNPETTSMVEFNDVAHKQLGYTRQEFSQMNVSDFETNQNPEKIKQVIKTTLKNGQSEFITKHRTKSGEIKTVLINQRKIVLSGQDLLLATCHDVTGINRLHNALRNSEERFNGIAHSVKDALILVDTQSKVTYWNPAAEKIFGYTNKEAIGKKIHELVVPTSMCTQGRESIKQSVKVFGETGMGYFTVGNVELIGRRRDGEEFPAELSISPLMLNGTWNAVGVVKDITDRKRTEQKIREAEQRYHSLFNHAPLGILVVDPATGLCVEFNDIAHSQLGYTREEFEKVTIFDLEVNDSSQSIKAKIEEIMTKEGAEFETLHQTKSGETRNVIVTTRAFQSAGKSYLHCIFHDITESKKVQNALLESEAQYRQLVELAEEGIWAINNDLVSVFVNPRMAQMLGYTESEIIGKSMVDFLNPNMRERIKEILLNFNQNDCQGHHEYAFHHKSGNEVETAITLSAITDDQKQKIGILAVISDITESKKAEKDLKESEERFRAISTSAIDAIILSDAADRVLYWNPAAEKTFGYTNKEAIGKKLSNLVIPASAREKHSRLLTELKDKPISRRHFGLTALKKNGSSFPMDLSVITVKLNGQNCLLTIIRDITEWKVMEEALRQEKELLESVAASTNIVLSIVNRDYRVIWANKTAKQTSGCNNIQNRRCFEVFGGNRTSICPDCGVKKVFEKGEGIVRRDYCTKIDGKNFWAELISTPIKDKEGNIVAALEVATDINERKHLQNKLVQYSQRLEEIVQQRTAQLKKAQADLVRSERLAAIGELASMVGHDLRNPLTGIKNSTYILKKKGDKLESGQTQEMLEIIDKCVNYSNRIINDLLDYSREIRLSLEEVSPRKLLADSLAMMDVPPKIQVKNQLKEKPTLEVDSDKIKRVFINLIKNAIDAMPEGGKITIENLKAKDGLTFSFTDTGLGINDEILPKLFSPLFTTKAKGMGFGLAICKRIVEAHRGTISVQTKKGQGTTFTLTLPYQQKIKTGGENVWISIPESSLLTTTKP